MHLFPKHPQILTSILAALVLPLALGCAAATADPVRVAAPSSASTAQNSSCTPKTARTFPSP